MSAAIYKDLDKKIFTDRYKTLLKHYKMKGEYIQADCPNENGDVEQRHYRFKKGLEQSLISLYSFAKCGHRAGRRSLMYMARSVSAAFTSSS